MCGVMFNHLKFKHISICNIFWDIKGCLIYRWDFVFCYAVIKGYRSVRFVLCIQKYDGKLSA